MPEQVQTDPHHRDATSRRLRRGGRLREPIRRTRADGARGRVPTGRVVGSPRRGSWARERRRGAGRVASWRPTSEQLAILSSLVGAGVTIEQAFGRLKDLSTSAATRAAAEHLEGRLSAGATLREALDDVASPALVRALMIAGDRVGRVGQSLGHASALLRSVEELRRSARQSMVYPSVILGIGLMIIVIVSVAVIPPLERTFADLGGSLPAPTRVVLSIGGFIRSLGSIALVLGAITLAWLARRLRTHRVVLQLSERVPLVGRARRDLQLALAARMLATMLGAGLPLVESMRVSAEALPPGPVQTALLADAAMRERGEGGEGTSGVGSLLDPVEQEMLAMGERSGLVGEQWSGVAERRAEGLAARMRRTAVLIEPLLVLLVGATVGGAVLALYLPTFRVLELL